MPLASAGTGHHGRQDKAPARHVGGQVVSKVCSGLLGEGTPSVGTEASVTVVLGAGLGVGKVVVPVGIALVPAGDPELMLGGEGAPLSSRRLLGQELLL